MVVVVLGREEGHVDHPHRLLQTGMQGGEGDQPLLPGVEAGDEALALAAEGLEEIGERTLVVVRLVGPAVRQIRGAQHFGAGQEIVQPAVVQLVEIEQVADVLLDRPRVAVPAGQEGGGEVADLLLDPRRRPAQALDDVREELLGEVEGEVAVEPAKLHGWIVGQARVGPLGTLPVHNGRHQRGGQSITSFVVYVSDNYVYRNTIGTLDAWVVLDPGTYSNVYIRAWDSSGSFGTSLTFSITVSGTVIPTPPASAVVFDNLDDASGWGAAATPAARAGERTPPPFR